MPGGAAEERVQRLRSLYVASREGRAVTVAAAAAAGGEGHEDELLAGAQVLDGEARAADVRAGAPLDRLRRPTGCRPRRAWSCWCRARRSAPPRRRGASAARSVDARRSRAGDLLHALVAGRRAGVRAATRRCRARDRGRRRHAADNRIDAVISDFGGVLTNHLIEAFAAFQDETGHLDGAARPRRCSACPSATASTRSSGSSAAS